MSTKFGPTTFFCCGGFFVNMCTPVAHGTSGFSCLMRRTKHRAHHPETIRKWWLLPKLGFYIFEPANISITSPSAFLSHSAMPPPPWFSRNPYLCGRTSHQWQPKGESKLTGGNTYQQRPVIQTATTWSAPPQPQFQPQMVSLVAPPSGTGRMMPWVSIFFLHGKFLNFEVLVHNACNRIWEKMWCGQSMAVSVQAWDSSDNCLNSD